MRVYSSSQEVAEDLVRIARELVSFRDSTSVYEGVHQIEREGLDEEPDKHRLDDLLYECESDILARLGNEYEVEVSWSGKPAVFDHGEDFSVLGKILVEIGIKVPSESDFKDLIKRATRQRN